MTDSDGSPLRLAPVPEEANTAIRPEKWKPVPGCSAYEASDYSVWQREEDGKLTQVTGGIRSVDRMSGNRRLKGQPIRARILANSGGYAAVDLTDDTGTRRTMLVHRVILAAHDKPCPPGMETLHSERGPLWNRYPEDIRWGTKPENAADKPEQSVLDATYPCRNAPACANMVVNQGRRCLDCVADVGRQAAGMRRAGQPWPQIAQQFGNSEDWVRKLARKHGGYEDSEPRSPEHRPCPCLDCAAPPQRSRGVVARLAATLRSRRTDRGKVTESDGYAK